jgi:hypothetical protein
MSECRHKGLPSAVNPVVAVAPEQLARLRVETADALLQIRALALIPHDV